MSVSPFRPDLLAGKVAFVTGGGSGICKGIAQAYAAHGADVAIVGRKQERLDAAAAEMKEATGRDVLPVAGDVRQPETVEAAVDATLDRFGRLDLVVNGAAGNFLQPAATMSYNAFRTVMDIDANGTFNVSRAAFERFLRDNGGVITNISANLHYGATPLQTHASAAKAAVDSVTRSMALEWGSLGIRVVGIAPGPIDDTEGVARLVPPDMKARLEKAIAIQRFGKIAEIADLAVFLASDAASLVTGTVVVADGGQWLGHPSLEL